MPELTFIFGPNNTFFFDSPKSWKFHSIPHTLRQLFNASMNPEWRIAQPICLALGPQINSPEPVWYVGCRVCSGEEKLFYSQNTFDQNYPSLSTWIKTIPNAPRAAYVTFGPNLSYFASAKGHGSIWAGVPSDLSDKVQKAYDTPNCVSLGLNNAWFVMWPDGYYSWKFYESYKGLDDILKEAEPRTVSYLAISPYNPEHYFVAFHDRTVKYNFNGAPEWMPQMQEVFMEWQTEIQQSQIQRYQQSQPQSQWVYPPVQSPGPLSPASPHSPRQQWVYPHMQSPGPIELPAGNIPMPMSMPPPTPMPMPTYPSPTMNFHLSPYNAMAATHPPPGRPVSIMSKNKKKSFFSRKLDKLSSKDSATAAGAVAVKATVMVASQGSQTCNVM